MKVIHRATMKVVPGKMTEAMETLQKHMTITSRYGAPSYRCYRPMIAGDDNVHTVIVDGEWDSLDAVAAFFDKLIADPEMQALTPKWDAVLESNVGELFALMP